MRKRGARGNGSGPWHGGACRPFVEGLDIRAFLLAQWIERTTALRCLVAWSALDPCQETIAAPALQDARAKLAASSRSA